MDCQDYQKEKAFEQENTIRCKEKKKGDAVAGVRSGGELC